MAKTFLEKRLVKEGVNLCIQRVEQGGAAVTVDDIRKLKVKTFSPALQWAYSILGSVLFVFGMWFQYKIGNMAVSMGLVLIGFLNLGYGIQGRPRPASSIKGLELEDLTAEIMRSFAAQRNQAQE